MLCSPLMFLADDGYTWLGFAMDGYGIYGPLESENQEIDLLDECYGNEDDTHSYHCHAASAEQNQHIACYHGKTVAGNERPGGGLPPGVELIQS